MGRVDLDFVEGESEPSTTLRTIKASSKFVKYRAYTDALDIRLLQKVRTALCGSGHKRLLARCMVMVNAGWTRAQ